MAQPVALGVVNGSGSAAAGPGPATVDVEAGPVKASVVGGVPLEVRNGFVRKVYMLLTSMLIVTTVVAAPFQLLSAEQVQENIRAIQVLMWGSLVTTLIMSCCCIEMMRRYPANYVFLFLFAVLYGVFVGAVTMFYTLPSVLLAAGMTAAMFFMLTGYACMTRHDFTGAGPYLLCALFGLIAFGILAFVLSLFCSSCYPWMQVVYAGAGAILFSMFIVYDTQLIVGGAHKKFSFSVDDYAFAALNLYLDIINLFLNILTLIGERE